MNVAFLTTEKFSFENQTFRFLDSIAGEGSGKILSLLKTSKVAPSWHNSILTFFLLPSIRSINLYG